jgi:DNA-binding response OmpR family regulator
MNAEKKKSILIVDDEIDLVSLIKDTLEEKGFNVLTAANGKEAFDVIYRESIPDLILLDMNMPVMNGWNFAHKFYDEFGRACPIVIMTAEEDSQTRALEIGADTYLGKPLEFDSIAKVVESMIDS